MARKGCKPVHRKVMDPNHEDGKIYRKDPEHQNEDGMRVVVEIVGRTGPGLTGLAKGAGTGSDLDETCYEVGELIGYKCRYQEEKDACGKNAPTRSAGSKCWRTRSSICKVRLISIDLSNFDLPLVIVSNPGWACTSPTINDREDMSAGQHRIVDKDTDSNANDTYQRYEKPEEGIRRPK